MIALQFENVSKSYGLLKVTDQVSFQLTDGEALGIIGPNGAGKSTLLNLINGTVAVDSGTIIMFGQDITRQSAVTRVRSGIGRSFQIPQPFEKLSVFENLLVAASFGQGKAEAAVFEECAHILQQTELIHRANTISGQLSLLDRKRLELARALATGPKILLLDEIAGGLTDGECHSLVETISNLKAKGLSIIWIEHVLHALVRVVDRLIVLDFGKLIAEGAVKDVLSSKIVQDVYLGADL